MEPIRVSENVTFLQRAYAFSLHFLLSCVLLGFALFLVFKVWYPSPLDYAAGVTSIYWLLLAIDLVLGPLLTFVVFKHERFRFLFDMAVILSVQLTAYTYGLYTMYQGRPAWLVYVIDDFELIRPVDIDSKDWSTLKSPFKLHLFTGPQWIGASYSPDPVVMKKQKEAEIFDGVSLARKPEAFVTLNEKAKNIQQAKHSLTELTQYNPPKKVHAYLQNFPSADAYVPVKGIEVDITALIDRQNRFLAAIPLNPWKE